jgi:hypothetical protein
MRGTTRVARFWRTRGDDDHESRMYLFYGANYFNVHATMDVEFVCLKWKQMETSTIFWICSFSLPQPDGRFDQSMSTWISTVGTVPSLVSTPISPFISAPLWFSVAYTRPERRAWAHSKSLLDALGPDHDQRHGTVLSYERGVSNKARQL